MWNFSKTLVKFIPFVALAALASCATQVTETPTQIKRSSVPFGQFGKAILLKTEMAVEYEGQGANEKAVKKIDEILAERTRALFDSIEVITLDEYKAMDLTQLSAKDVLVIKPYIKQIKFIGGAARFWAGAMAGSSVVVMDTHFIDAASGEVVGEAGFYRRAGAYTDAFGTASNRMLEDVAQDVVNYIATNR